MEVVAPIGAASAEITIRNIGYHRHVAARADKGQQLARCHLHHCTALVLSSTMAWLASRPTAVTPVKSCMPTILSYSLGPALFVSLIYLD